MPLTDAEAIERSLGEPDQFRLVFERHHAGVWRYLRHRLGADAAEEVAGETFVRAFAVRARYRDATGSALPWLLGIATNLAAGHWRREARRLRAYARCGEELADELDVDGLVARLAAVDEGPALAGALAALRPDDRETRDARTDARGGLSWTRLSSSPLPFASTRPYSRPRMSAAGPRRA